MANTFVGVGNVGPKIKAQLKLYNMSQSELGRRLCVSRKTVWTWITGKHTPTKYYIRQMADIFGCSTRYLLGEFD